MSEMEQPARADPRLFLEVLGEEIRNFELYKDLLYEEEEAVLSENPEKLGAVLDAKQELIEKNAAIEQRIAPMRAALAASPPVGELSEKVAEENRRLEALIRELMAIQGRNEAQLRTTLDEMQKKMKKLSTGEKALTTYGSSFKGIRRIPKYIDKRR